MLFSTRLFRSLPSSLFITTATRSIVSTSTLTYPFLVPRRHHSYQATTVIDTATEDIPAIMSAAETFIELAKARRSYYVLGRKSPVPDSRVEELVKDAILHVPSSFNTQSTRLVLLLHKDHDKAWDLVNDSLYKLYKSGVIPEQAWNNHTKPKIASLKAAYGTILFYEDPAHIQPCQEKFPIYKEHFVPWAEHSNAMHQWFLWTALTSLGFGGSLQHYNPLIDEDFSNEWNIPADWKLIGQLVFGSIEGPVKEKEFKPVEGRVMIHSNK